MIAQPPGKTGTDGKNSSESNTADLWQKYRQGAYAGAVEGEIVEKYLPLVKTVVGRIAMTLPAHVDIEDLYSSGLVGLLNAVRNFDPKNGNTFETYARFRIRGAVFDELRRLDWVPRSVHSKARKVQNVVHELEQARGRIPTNDEMARALKITPSEYEQWLIEIRPATFVCLDAAAHHDEDGAAQYENIADARQEDPWDGTAKRELARLIAARIEELPEMQRKVLALYYFEDMRLREIAEAFGLTESRICQIHSQAILALRSYLDKHDACPA